VNSSNGSLPLCPHLLQRLEPGAQALHAPSISPPGLLTITSQLSRRNLGRVDTSGSSILAHGMRHMPIVLPSSSSLPMAPLPLAVITIAVLATIGMPYGSCTSLGDRRVDSRHHEVVRQRRLPSQRPSRPCSAPSRRIGTPGMSSMPSRRSLVSLRQRLARSKRN
jgi:hypothetical protein